MFFRRIKPVIETFDQRVSTLKSTGYKVEPDKSGGVKAIRDGFGALLKEADLESVTVSANSPAAGKLIRELQLRTVTGASIVGIERNGTSLINPGPDEEMHPGDQVLLLGNRQQLDAARAEFSALKP